MNDSDWVVSADSVDAEEVVRQICEGPGFPVYLVPLQPAPGCDGDANPVYPVTRPEELWLRLAYALERSEEGRVRIR